MIELGTVALACAGLHEVADASPFGRAGTLTIAVIGIFAAVVGTVLAQRGPAGPLVTVAGILTCICAPAGFVAVLAFFYFIAGGPTIVLAVLLTHAALSLAMIGWAVLRPKAR